MDFQICGNCGYEKSTTDGRYCKACEDEAREDAPTGPALTDEIAADVAAGGALADATAEGLAQEYAAQIAAAPTADAANDRYLAIRTTYRSRGEAVPVAVIDAMRARHTMERAQDLYRAACAADDAFSEALRSEYGAEAREARYLPTEMHPEWIQRLAARKARADAAWGDAYLAAQVAPEAEREADPMLVACEECGRQPAESVDGGMRGERFLCRAHARRAAAIGEAF